MTPRMENQMDKKMERKLGVCRVYEDFMSCYQYQAYQATITGGHRPFACLV